MTEFALVFKQMQKQVCSDPETFAKFIDEFVKTSKPSQEQVEQSAQIASKLEAHLEAFKETGSIAVKPVVGLVEGVFDMLHFGHFNAIRQASLCCDELIVGVNCDETVRKHKGRVNQTNSF